MLKLSKNSTHPFSDKEGSKEVKNIRQYSCLKGFNGVFKKGFSLVELALVIMIIGLLTSAIIGAHSLVNVSRVNYVITNFRQVENATGVFKASYEQLPGDSTLDTVYSLSSGKSVDLGGSRGNGDGVVKVGGLEGCTANCGIESYNVFVELSRTGVFSSSVTTTEFSESSITADDCAPDVSSKYLIPFKVEESYAMVFTDNGGLVLGIGLLNPEATLTSDSCVDLFDSNFIVPKKVLDGVEIKMDSEVDNASGNVWVEDGVWKIKMSF